MRQIFVLLLLFSATTAPAQKGKKEDQRLLDNLKKHVYFLAADSLQGRRTGTPGEAAAARYIAAAFAANGVQPKGTNAFLQPFEVYEGKQIDSTTFLSVDGKLLQLGEDFYPLAFSANATVQALPSVALHEGGMPWFVDLKEVLEKNSSNPHYDVRDFVRQKAKEVASKEATALFVYNSSGKSDGLAFDKSDRSDIASIPVVYLTGKAMRNFFKDQSATFDISLKTQIGPKTRTGNNVIGFINNNAPATVVIGAHYDHLGHGEDGNSLQRESHDIHNGADDNASGTAALIELSRLLKASGPKAYNYMLIAFSGEELGLFGSKYFTEQSAMDLSTVHYMINMDMIGRLNPATPTLTVGGYGTSPSWATAFAASGKKGVYKEDLQLKFDSSGSGPSDHTSFYRKNIPVLFYFTGVHSDYHKPSDDADKINYEGMVHVVKNISSVIAYQSRQGKPSFTPTREVQMQSTAFKVTLGIMPDYSFSGKGVRVDGISDNRPAQKAGIKAGDVILKLGDVETSSMEQYMQALGKFEKGQKTVVQFVRNGATQTAEVMF